ncbi:MAG: hypothetical protein ACT4OL_05905 [Nitrospiraceae bacterium]
MTEELEQRPCLSMTSRPIRRPTRVTHEYLCAAAVDGLRVEGITVDLNETSLQDLSFTGYSALFPYLPPDRLWGAPLRIKFEARKAMRIGIIHFGPDTLVRFRAEDIREGEV